MKNRNILIHHAFSHSSAFESNKLNPALRQNYWWVITKTIREILIKKNCEYLDSTMSLYPFFDIDWYVHSFSLTIATPHSSVNIYHTTPLSLTFTTPHPSVSIYHTILLPLTFTTLHPFVNIYHTTPLSLAFTTPHSFVNICHTISFR